MVGRVAGRAAPAGSAFAQVPVGVEGVLLDPGEDGGHGSPLPAVGEGPQIPTLFNTQTDLYFDPDTGRPSINPLAYSTAVESYEYSKQPMNNTSFESGAGLALAYGPVLNPQQLGGDDGLALLVDRIQTFAIESNAGGPTGRELRRLAGTRRQSAQHPRLARFLAGRSPSSRASIPTIAPSTNGNKLFCSFTAGYAGSGAGAQVIGDYECVVQLD